MKENQTRILLVDEESPTICRVRDCLESSGYTVHMTGDGHSAIELATSWLPDHIILGCRMPDLNGHEICRRIREFSWVPIIILAASHRESDELEGFKSGADDYVTRPFSVNELEARVRAVLRRAEWATYGDPWRLLKAPDPFFDLVPVAVE